MLHKCETPLAGGVSRDIFAGTSREPYARVLHREFGLPIINLSSPQPLRAA